MGIKNVVKKIADKSAGTVSKLASLSSEELEKIENQRLSYLFDMPSVDDDESLELTGRLMAAASVEIYNAYLPQIKNLYSPIKNNVEYGKDFIPGHNIRYINITKWVTNKEENSLEKLINVYEVLSNEECNIALVFNRTVTKTNVYLAVTNTLNENNNTNIDIYKRRIVDAIKGNFPGSEYIDDGIGTLPCFNDELKYSIASASNIPAEKSEKFISQTIEKLLDGIVPIRKNQEYTIVLLATPIQDVEERKLKLAEFYTALSPYASWQTDFHFNDMQAFGASATIGVNVGASAGVQKGTNHSNTDTDGSTTNESKTDTDTTSEAVTKGSNDTAGGSIFGSGTASAGVLGTGASATAGASVDYHHTWSRSKTSTTGKSVAKTVGKAITKSSAKTIGSTASGSLGANFGANFARSSSVTATVGKNEGITQSHTNYTIKHTLEVLEEQMKRYKQSVALGMWDFAAYILSEDMDIANNVAHSYVALTQGEKSYMSQASINLWRGDTDSEESLNAKEIYQYISNLRHPIFGLDPGIINLDSTFLVYPSVVTATTGLSGKELAYSLNFPKSSISGLPVIECTEFGRDISRYSQFESEKNIKLGNIFHMNHMESTTVSLDVNSMASHTFITGSTGTGKSTTVYRLLNELRKKDVNFLVIEPAKGEYKNIFGNRKDVNVFGTNPKKNELLKLNPFSFNEDIHVLEHIDRLTELFNVCWPMYAAMPAVLKKAIEYAYKDCGWDLDNSINEYSESYYPTFTDVARNIKSIIDSSEYDAENKGAYKGSLLTRLESLTNGINGMIFTKDELSDEILFDENTIVDLSRVGSNETKSLLMGILVLKLQEYRMSTSDMNANLRHITVLEEAHNLLKRTSFEQFSESSNLLGKSVEMISNAIAEMRTFGEGFIIADQAPALLDMAAIRNTNTKIIMRLPDQGDRELVGKAANLNDNQIKELARLPKGVAAIYQNEWIEPILCQIKKPKINESRYEFTPIPIKGDIEPLNNYRSFLATLISKCNSITDENTLKEIKVAIDSINIHDSSRVAIINWLTNPPKEPKMTKMAPLISELYPEVYRAVAKSFYDSNNPREWTLAAVNTLENIDCSLQGQIRRDIIQSIITNHIYLERNDIKSLEKWTKVGGLK